MLPTLHGFTNPVYESYEVGGSGGDVDSVDSLEVEVPAEASIAFGVIGPDGEAPVAAEGVAAEGVARAGFPCGIAFGAFSRTVTAPRIPSRTDPMNTELIPPNV